MKGKTRSVIALIVCVALGVAITALLNIYLLPLWLAIATGVILTLLLCAVVFRSTIRRNNRRNLSEEQKSDLYPASYRGSNRTSAGGSGGQSSKTGSQDDSWLLNPANPASPLSPMNPVNQDDWNQSQQEWNTGHTHTQPDPAPQQEYTPPPVYTPQPDSTGSSGVDSTYTDSTPSIDL